MGKQTGKAKPATKDLEPRTDEGVKGGSATSDAIKNIGQALSTGASKG